MPLPVSYMGTKRQLAGHVAEIASLSPPGPLLDVFSGMCAVASAVAPKRQIWTNDLQHFARAVSQAHFCSRSAPPSRLDAAALVMGTYSQHIRAHSAIASGRLASEESALKNGDCSALNQTYDEWQDSAPLPRRELSSGVDAVLFRDTFAGAYFGLSQSIEIDAIRRGLDDAFAEERLDTDQHRWLLLALCVALSKCSTSTGHFAQPLTAKTPSIRRFAKQRSRSIRDEWLGAVELLKPVGGRRWRGRNRAYLGEAVETLKCLQNETSHPAVVYADPPYTDDQYSRFYHVYDTLIRYDYPESFGRGRYRPDRAVSTFSLSSKVTQSLGELIESSANIGADLIISYPTNGLMANSRDLIPALIRDHFGNEPTVYEIAHQHSTMGASKGVGKHNVTEVIYRAFH